jgi:hypothetical protein
MFNGLPKAGAGMRRRQFLGLVGGAAIWPLAARAQQKERLRRVDVLLAELNEDDPYYEGRLRALTEALRRPLPPRLKFASSCRSFSLLVVEGPIRAIEQPINLALHDEVVLMQYFDLLGAQRDSSIAPAEADVRVMAFWLGKLTNFHEEAHSMDDACTNWAEEFFSRMRSAEIGIHHHIAGAYLLRYAQERSWRGGQPPSVER